MRQFHYRVGDKVEIIERRTQARKTVTVTAIDQQAILFSTGDSERRITVENNECIHFEYRLVD